MKHLSIQVEFKVRGEITFFVLCWYFYLGLNGVPGLLEGKVGLVAILSGRGLVLAEGGVEGLSDHARVLVVTEHGARNERGQEGHQDHDVDGQQALAFLETKRGT